MPRPSLLFPLALGAAFFACSPASGQQTPAAPQPPPATAPGTVPGTSSGYRLISPVVEPTLTPGVAQLIELEEKFAADTAKGGGKAFASWFAEDAVALSNGQRPTIGRAAIAADANWDPKDYSLTWTAQGAQMGPSNDMGFTWGHYIARYKDKSGSPIEKQGRYTTIWKKQTDGAWKVELDCGSDDAPEAGACCALPKP